MSASVIWPLPSMSALFFFHLIDHLHDVGSVHLVIAVGVALEADLKRGRAADGIVAAVLVGDGHSGRTHIRIVAVADGVL